MSRTIVLVDDHPDILEMLKFNLNKEGYNVQCFSNSINALDYIQNSKPDLVVTDWMMPEMDGLELCRNIKFSPLLSQVPVLMLSCKSDEIDVVTALELGAEDYVVKPVRIKELITRLKKILKKQTEIAETVSENDQNIITRGDLKIDLNGFQAYLEGELMDLTFTEFKILELLTKKPGKVYTRNDIIEKINGLDYYVSERSVDVQVVGLRKKMKHYKDLIETIRFVGYCFRKPA